MCSWVFFFLNRIGIILKTSTGIKHGQGELHERKWINSSPSPVSFLIIVHLMLMALVLIKGRELCILDATPDAWTGEMFVPPNQSCTPLSLFFSCIQASAEITTRRRLEPRAGERHDIRDERVFITPQGYDASKKCLCIRREGRYEIYVASGSNKEKERKCRHQPVASQHAMPCFLEARLKAQAYTACAWFVLGCLKCRTRLHRMDPRGPGSLIRKTRAPVLKPG